MIRVDGVSKFFGSTCALDQVSVTVLPGEITAILGPNGSGKSTLIRIILGLTKPDSGSALVLGAPYAKLDNPLRKVGACLDTDGAYANRTAYQHLRVLALAGGLSRSLVICALEKVGLGAVAHRKVRTFSLGMKQRLAIAAACLGNPEVLILDEPQTGLDVDGVLWLREFLVEEAKAGKTVLISSHSMQEVEALANTVIFLNEGNILESGSTANLIREFGNLETAYRTICSR